MPIYERIVERPWVKALEDEHGPWVKMKDKEGRTIRQFSDGFFTTIDRNGNEFPCDGWQGSQFTRFASHRQSVFLHESMVQAEQRMNSAREDMEAEIQKYITTGEEVEDLEAKKQYLSVGTQTIPVVGA